jgi:hypothetical protein
LGIEEIFWLIGTWRRDWPAPVMRRRGFHPLFALPLFFGRFGEALGAQGGAEMGLGNLG